MSETLCTLRTKGGGGITGADLLWTNETPSVSTGFSAQTVSIDLTNYDAIILRTAAVYTTIPSSYPTYLGDQILIPKSNVGDICFGYFISGGTSYYACHRSVSVSDSGVDFGGGYQNGQSINTRAIPVSIYGVKFSIT